MSENVENWIEVRASDSSDGRVHVSHILSSITRTESDSSSIAGVRWFKCRNFVAIPVLSSDALHFLFSAVMARLSSVGMSKIPVLNVSFNRPEVIVFVEQSDSIADASIQRG